MRSFKYQRYDGLPVLKHDRRDLELELRSRLKIMASVKPDANEAFFYVAIKSKDFDACGFISFMKSVEYRRIKY
jgi:hypothetical protein